MHIIFDPRDPYCNSRPCELTSCFCILQVYDMASFLIVCLTIVIFCALSFIVIFRTATSSDASDAGFSVDDSVVHPFITTFNMVNPLPFPSPEPLNFVQTHHFSSSSNSSIFFFFAHIVNSVPVEGILR